MTIFIYFLGLTTSKMVQIMTKSLQGLIEVCGQTETVSIYEAPVFPARKQSLNNYSPALCFAYRGLKQEELLATRLSTGGEQFLLRQHAVVSYGFRAQQQGRELQQHADHRPQHGRFRLSQFPCVADLCRQAAWVSLHPFSQQVQRHSDRRS
jgi:hypothetical protein